MIVLAVTAALIIQTYDGQTRVVENLTDEGCAAARCLSQYGHSCAEEDSVKRSLEAYEKLHPYICPSPTPRRGGGGIIQTCHRQGEPESSIVGISTATPMNATKTAMCVK